jgi:hypothetical protein
MNRAIALLPAVLFTASSASAATLRVPSEYPTIQWAITSAVDGDTVLVQPGMYQEALSFANKDLTLVGDGTPESVVIHTASISRVLMVGPGVTRRTTLRNLTIRDGHAEEGGGLKLVGASPVLTNCHFLFNVVAREDSTSKGGGLFVDPASNPLVTQCLFEDNIADLYFPQIFPNGEGGAIYVASQGRLSLRNSTFRHNTARGFEGGSGGAIYLAAQSSATIDSSLFVRNSAFGGGIFSEGSADVRGCTFNGNFGWTGPALLMYGTCSIERNLIYDNQTDGTEGGAVWVYSGGMVVSNTIAFNRAMFDYAGLYAGNGTLISRNVIAANLGRGFSSCFTDPELVTCNDVWGNTANYPPQCDLTGLNGNISADPLFCDSASGDFRLLPASPCAPNNSPAECGLIGALPICGMTGIDVVYSPQPQMELIIRPNPVTNVAEFFLQKESKVRAIEVYDSAGRFVDQPQSTRSRLTWVPPASVPNGVYFARFEVEGKWRSVKFTLIR